MLRIVALAAGLALAACASDKPTQSGSTGGGPGSAEGRSSYKVGAAYSIRGRSYRPEERFRHVETGRASWYGPGFDGKPTANGEIFDAGALTAAHRTLQLPSIVRVTNLNNGESAILRINDRGPYHGDRVLDVSEAAADALGFRAAGVALVRIELLEGPSREVARLAQAGATVAEVDAVRARADRPAPLDRPAPEATLAAAPPATAQPQPRPAPQPRTVVAAAPEPQPQSRPEPQAEPARGFALAKPAAAEPAPAAASARAFVQVGAFGDVANVQRLRDRLVDIGGVEVTPFESQGRTLHRVRLGPYTTLASAEDARARVVGLGIPDARVVTVQ